MMTREQAELIVLSFLDDLPTAVQREAIRKLDAHDAEQRQALAQKDQTIATLTERVWALKEKNMVFTGQFAAFNTLLEAKTQRIIELEAELARVKGAV